MTIGCAVALFGRFFDSGTNVVKVVGGSSVFGGCSEPAGGASIDAGGGVGDGEEREPDEGKEQKNDAC